VQAGRSRASPKIPCQPGNPVPAESSRARRKTRARRKIRVSREIPCRRGNHGGRRNLECRGRQPPYSFFFLLWPTLNKTGILKRGLITGKSRPDRADQHERPIYHSKPLTPGVNVGKCLYLQLVDIISTAGREMNRAALSLLYDYSFS
jgi:hypothetical protein